MALHAIDDSAIDGTKREAYRQVLIAYMGWRSPETIQAYDHHLRQLDFAPVHAVLIRLGAKEEIVTAQPYQEAQVSVGAQGIPDELKRLLNRAMEANE